MTGFAKPGSQWHGLEPREVLGYWVRMRRSWRGFDEGMGGANRQVDGFHGWVPPGFIPFSREGDDHNS